MRAVVVKKLKDYRPGGTLYLKEPTAKELARRAGFLSCQFCKYPVHKSRLAKHLTVKRKWCGVLWSELRWDRFAKDSAGLSREAHVKGFLPHWNSNDRHGSA